MGGDPSLDRELRQKHLAEHNPDFEDLEDEFYELEQTADIEQAVLAFIREHPAAFYFSGEIRKVVLPNVASDQRE